jgi:threonine dehydrogenase-like Zn-dependent dehydrogenase
MKALRSYGKGDVRVEVEDVPEPEIIDNRDVLLRITSTAIAVPIYIYTTDRSHHVEG